MQVPIDIFGGLAFLGFIVAFRTLWVTSSTLRHALVLTLVPAFAIGVLLYLFPLLFPEGTPGRDVMALRWLIFGVLVAFVPPVLGILLAAFSRRRFAQFRAMADR